MCEELFQNTTTRNAEGRFSVKLPFKSPDAPLQIGASKQIATACWKRVAARVDRDNQRTAYDEFMQEILDLGHMTEIPENEDSTHYVFLPHHPVWRQESITTKLRVVVNASAKFGGISLNDTLCTGPKLQNDIPDVVINWRRYPYVYGADMKQMFRQIEIHPEDRWCQCIAWCSAGTPETKFYKVNTVIYGTKSAPYLANRVVKEIAKVHGNEYPLAVEPLDEDTYVDDVMFGAFTKEEAIQKRDQVEAALKRGCLELRKWMSNCPDLLPDKTNSSDNLYLAPEDKDQRKILGISWSSKNDCFSVQLNKVDTSVITKRTILSNIARLYDPLGWLTPFIVRAKILLQSLWLTKCDWDDRDLPNQVIQEWHALCSEMEALTQITIPRYFGTIDVPVKTRFVGFSDASSRAFSAVLYVYLEYANGEVKSTLMRSKTKVSPLKTLSIPRLELNGAVLLAKLIDSVRSKWRGPLDEVICYTDSRIVLSWLEKHASTWHVYVANRISFIQTTLNQVKWLHIPSKQNPADLNSRGLKVTELTNSTLWWQGPTLMTELTDELQPEEQERIQQEVTKEQRQTACLLTTPKELPEYLFRYSTWNKLVRALAFWIKFIHALRWRIQIKDNPELETPVELQSRLWLTRSLIRAAENIIIREVQQHAFPHEIVACKAKQPVHTGSIICQICPFLDDEGILRAEGRLVHSQDLSEDEKHPIIMPKHEITRLLIRHYHVKSLHGGTQATLTMLRQRYWIIHARNQTKYIISRCTQCVRYKAKLLYQKMAPLPRTRCSAQRPFSRVGIDYAGPFQMRNGSGRGYKSHKVWICVFVCFATRAIHLEIADDYSTKAFLDVFDCFVARRGLPNTIYSDQATNFKGAEAELSAAFKAIQHDPDIHNKLASEGVEWSFIPPVAAHQGGLWESGVRAVKQHLRPLIANFTPTWAEMRTMICKIEAVLNSRPLTPSSDEARDGLALTPAHFLVGSPLLTVPQDNLEDLNVSLLTRWQTVSHIAQGFWKRWKNEYLHQLQARSKWQREEPNLEVNDIVLMRDPNRPPGDWALARVIETRPGKDGLVRDAVIKTETTTLVRPITQLCKLPVAPDNTENKHETHA